ncbi:MAG: hypothetical protein VW440_00520 [Bordetella sp.]
MILVNTKRILAGMALAGSLVMSGCASKPSPPSFLSAAETAMARGSQAYLEGNSRRSAIEYERAVQLLSQTGRAELIAKAVLTQCAAAFAGLQFERCAAFDALAQDASMTDRAYARLLNGELTANDLQHLPDTHRRLGEAITQLMALTSQSQTTEAQLAAALSGGIAAAEAQPGPFSKLLALALLRRYGWPDGLTWPAGVNQAEGQGWRRPLLAWLEVGLQEKSRSGDVITRERLLRQRQRVLELGSGRR